MTPIIETISIIILIAGLLGAILPALPGLPLAFLGALIFAWATNFEILTVPGLVGLGVLAVLSLVIDYAAGLLAGRYAGASWLGLLGALVGGIVGSLSFGLIGLIVGPAVGVLVVEYLRRREAKKSLRIATGILIGSVIGIAAGAVLGVIFLIIFLTALFI